MSVVKGVRRSARSCAATLGVSLFFVGSAALPAAAQPTTTSVQTEAEMNVGIGARTTPDAPVATPAPAPAPAPAPSPASSPAPTPAPAPASSASTPAASNATEPTTPAAATTASGTDAAPGEAATAEQASADEAPEELPWAVRHRRYNTVTGTSGGIHIMDPGSGAEGSVRLQLAFDIFSGSDYLYENDEVQQNGQSLSIGWTPVEYLELWGTLLNRSSSITEDTEAGDKDTSLSVMGDIAVGVKMHATVGDIVRLGGGLRLLAMNSLGGSGVLDATGIGLTAAAALDLTGLQDPFPLIGRLTLDYYFDNSSSLAEQVEQDKYDALEAADPDVAPIEDEATHLLSRFERFGLGIGRVDVLTIGAGVEFPLTLSTDTYLHPIIEYSLGLPINRQGYDCPFFSSDKDRGTIYSQDDNCVDDSGFVTFPQQITVGARFIPPVRGLSTFAAIDLTITGAKEFAREMAPLPSYRVYFGLGYDYDAEPPPPPPAPQVVEAEREAIVVPTGRVLGLVVESGTGQPVSDARVAFMGKNLSALSTSDTGSFISYPFEPGTIVVEVREPAYAPTQCSAVIPEQGGDVNLTCTLEPLPRVGQLDARVRDPYGNTLPGAVLHLTGASQATLTTDPRGQATASELPGGDYEVMIEAPGHLAREARVHVTARETNRVEFTLAKRPARAAVTVAGDRILVPSLRFVGDSTQLAPGGDAAMAELSDLLLRDSSIRRLRIQAPGSGAVSLTRGLLLKQRLLDAGIDDGRIEALGGGRGTVSISVVERAAY